MRQLEIVPTFETQLGAKILPNAHAVADVDGDDATELLFGSIAGDVAIFKIKGDRFVKWRSCSVDGSVTAICVDTSTASDARVFVATAEGSCFVVTESGDEFRVSSEFRVSLNVCALAVLDGDLVVGTRDGGLYIYQADANALGGYKQLEKVAIKREIASFRLLATVSSATVDDIAPQPQQQLVVCCTTGEFFHVATLSIEHPKKRTVQLWRAPTLVATTAIEGSTTSNNSSLSLSSAADRVSYIVDSSSGRQEDDNDDDAAVVAHPQLAVASLSGHVAMFQSVDASYDLQWRLKLPEAVVALDRLRLASSSRNAKTRDALVACTWSGQLYAIMNEHDVVRFRMLYPAATMFCADVFESATQSDRVLVAISTSGVIVVFRQLASVLARGLARTSLSAAIHAHALLDAATNSDTKRQALVAAAAIAASSTLSHLPVDAIAVARANPTLDAIVRLAVQMRSSST